MSRAKPVSNSWLIWLLLAAAVVVAGIIVFVTSHAVTAKGPFCNPLFPARVGQYPSWVYVLTAIAAFALGHAVSQVGIRNAKASEDELGSGQWSKRSAVAAVNAAVAVFLFLVAIMLGFEAWAIDHRAWPITYYTRCATDANAFLALIGSAAFAFVVGRWMWVFKS